MVVTTLLALLILAIFSGALWSRLATCRKSEREFRSIFERAPAGSFIFCAETGKILSANRKFCQLTGYGHAELLQMEMKQLFPHDERERRWTLIEELLSKTDTEWSFERRYLRKD